MKIRSPVILKRPSHGCRARDVTTGKIGRIAPPLLYPRREYLRSSDCTWLFWFRSVGSVCLRVSTVFLFCYLLYFAKIKHKKIFKARIFQFIVEPKARGHLHSNTNELQGGDIRTPISDSSTPTIFKF
jgi:hypothetical protein